MTQDITSLIEKLEGAEVGSRELDGGVLKATGHGYHMDFGNGWYARPGHNERIYGNGPSQVTTSLDAALALAERLELSVGEILNDALEGPAGVGIWQSGWNGTISTIPQIARFVCIAILRAQSEAR